MNILGKRTRSISAIVVTISTPLTIPLNLFLSLFLIGAELAVSAPPKIPNPSIALEGVADSPDLDRLTSSPRPGVLVLIGIFVLICATPWGRILQAVRKKK
jgi:hypothetical protein